jgi:hypothetical protein
MRMESNHGPVYKNDGNRKTCQERTGTLSGRPSTVRVLSAALLRDIGSTGGGPSTTDHGGAGQIPRRTGYGTDAETRCTTNSDRCSVSTIQLTRYHRECSIYNTRFRAPVAAPGPTWISGGTAWNVGPTFGFPLSRILRSWSTRPYVHDRTDGRDGHDRSSRANGGSLPQCYRVAGPMAVKSHERQPRSVSGATTARLTLVAGLHSGWRVDF